MKPWRLVVALGLLAGSVGAVAPAASAASYAPAGSIGHDVSYPQCDKPLPAGGAFGVVGVTGGKNFTSNRCLATQWAWASSLPSAGMVYLNTGNPGNQSMYWPASMTTEYAHCADATSASDDGCAYIYGARAAAYALTVATDAGVPVGGRTWWLDVETANSWDGDGAANAADIQGAYDYLRGHGVDSVGLYSTGLQWTQITGGFHAANLAPYKMAWALSFTPQYPMEQAPLWVAGVTAAKAVANCATSFTGGPTVLAQYIDASFDHNLVCGAATGNPKDPCKSGAAIPAGYTPVYGTGGNDKLRGSSKDEIFFGGGGDDDIRGGNGEDILCGGSGRDDLRGGDDNDHLDGSSGRDDLSGDNGRDTLYGGTANDDLSGGGGKDTLYGGDGDDHLAGGGAADTLYGQAGRDSLNGGSGGDKCSGGSGQDPRSTSC